MLKKINLKKKFIFLLFIFLFFTIFLLSNVKKEIILAGENFGGWAYDNFFGWTSESCNNLYEDDYQDYCGIGIEPILDVTFDSNNIDLGNGVVHDMADNFDGILYNFSTFNIRNGGKNKTSGTPVRDSNFNNSLYFNGWNSYINFGIHNELTFSGDPFTLSLWFKIDQDMTGEGFLFSNGSEMNKRYHCWIDASYYLNCAMNGQELRSDQVIDKKIWNNVSIVYDGNNFLMYLNGYIENGVAIGSFPVAPSPAALILGSNSSYDSIFQGELDEFRFFDEELDLGEILHNTKHNSNYLLDIEEGTGLMNGWIWSNGIGWICIGDTCNGTAPDGSEPEANLYWSYQGENKYPHMIEGWANAVAFNDAAQPDYQDIGWISLQSPNLIQVNYDQYKNCISCFFRDEEDDLVLYLKMDEDIGSWAMDSSGFDNNAFLRGFEESAWVNDGRVNNCLIFDGQDDYLNISISSDKGLQIGYSDFTVEAWVKNEKDEHTFDLLPIIKAKSSEEWKMYLREESIFFEIFGISMRGEVSNIDEWTHVIVVVDRNAKMKMYINGEKKSELDISGSSGLDIKNNALSIGLDDLGNFWDDKLDIIRLYKRVLTEDEIVYNYKSPDKRFCSACLSQTLDSSDTDNICYNCQRCTETNGINNCEECSSCREYGLAFDSNTANIKGYAWGGNLVNGEVAGMGWFKFSPSAGAGLYRSYVSSKYGNVYSRENIGSNYTVAPPTEYFNATYIIQANGHITNWNSEMDWYMSADNNTPLNYLYPKLENDYTNVLGNLDYDGLIGGLYGLPLENLPNEGTSNYNACLEGGVYVKNEDYILEDKVSGVSYNFLNCDQAAGTILIEGDLTIEGDIKYNNDTFSGSSEKLASVAWIIKGDLKINPEVEKLAGTFIVLGRDGVDCGYDQDNPVSHCGSIFTCNGEESQCGKKLEVSGQFLAKNFVFGRTYRSLTGNGRDPAEYIIYDGRNVINPPPGLGDVLKTLPSWNQVAPY